MDFILDNLEFIVVIAVFYWFYMQNQKKNAELAALQNKTDEDLEKGKVEAQEIKEEMVSEAVKSKIEKIEIIKNAIAVKEAEIAKEVEELKTSNIQEAIEIIEEVLQDDVEEDVFIDVRQTLVINTPDELKENMELILKLKKEFGPFKVNITYPISSANGFGPSTRRNKRKMCDCNGGLYYNECHFSDKLD